MREILFRGKTEDGKWEYGYPYEIYRNCHTRKVIAQPPNEFGRGKYVEVISETVGQFTGLTDKNGTKIFEGDILNTTNSNCRIWFVDYKNTAFCSNQGNVNYSCVLDEFMAVSDVEVIGNIHDNPELIGGADNEKQ